MRNARDRKAEIPTKDLVFKLFMKSPIPMSISKTEDGTYVDVNESAVKFMGLPREKIIGRTSSELGHTPLEKRRLFIDAIKEHGFAKNIPLELNIGNKGILHMLYSVYPIKIGRKSYFLSVATDVSNNHPGMKESHIDKFYKTASHDYKFVKEKLKQFKLTARRQEIALLFATGYSNDEIADKLHISDYTVKDHVKEIFRIIGINNRRELFPKLLNLR